MRPKHFTQPLSVALTLRKSLLGLAFQLFLTLAPAASLAREPALPSFKMTAATSAGIRKFNSDELAGKVWIADFILTRCGGPCPLLTSNMARLDKQLPSSIMLVSFTVDPPNDTGEALQRYAKRHHAGPKRWVFLTAPEARIKRLLFEGFKVAFARDSSAPDGMQITHSSKFVLVGKDGRVVRYYDGDDSQSLKALVRDAASLDAATAALRGN